MPIDRANVSTPPSRPGPYLAKVVSHHDKTYMGGLEVELLRQSGNTNSAGQLHSVKYMSPFYGCTGVEYVSGSDNNYNSTQKSYGMWMVPPDPGTTVVVIFIDGDPKRGYWIGCVQDDYMNFMVPGIASTKFVVKGDGTKQPVAEYNKRINSTVTDTTQIPKPKHPFAQVLVDQGLVADDIRGTTSSSARRETPSAVFGISTPGPIDKAGPMGSVGKAEHKVSAPVSRLGGSSFVMDDGDDKFIRTGPASTTASEYVAVERAQKGSVKGDSTIPHNELLRIRTRTGHQILMHNSEDLIYIGNAKGTTWVELTSNGKIDIYASDSVSVYSGTDINLTAKRDINLTTHEGSINFNSGANIGASAVSNFEIRAEKDGKITTGTALHLKSAHHIETSDNIEMNGTAAQVAHEAPLTMRVPRPEPWWGHENLDPTIVKGDKTVSVAPDKDNPRQKLIDKVLKVPETPPKAYKKPTVVDTFSKEKGKG